MSKFDSNFILEDKEISKKTKNFFSNQIISKVKFNKDNIELSAFNSEIIRNNLELMNFNIKVGKEEENKGEAIIDFHPCNEQIKNEKVEKKDIKIESKLENLLELNQINNTVSYQEIDKIIFEKIYTNDVFFTKQNNNLLSKNNDNEMNNENNNFKILEKNWENLDTENINPINSEINYYNDANNDDVPSIIVRKCEGESFKIKRKNGQSSS